MPRVSRKKHALDKMAALLRPYSHRYNGSNYSVLAAQWAVVCNLHLLLCVHVQPPAHIIESIIGADNRVVVKDYSLPFKLQCAILCQRLLF